MHINSPLRPRLATAAGAIACAALIAGCGSSSKPSSTITVGNESSTLPAEVSTTPTSTATVKTPTSGPLSKEPKVKPPSGPAPTKLQTKEIIKGTGAEAKKGDKVTVNYVGVLYHGGKIFDASWNRKETFSFTLGASEVIKGWEEGVLGMHVNGRRELIIPSNLAYGKQGSGSTIPPNAPLVFVVDLLAA